MKTILDYLKQKSTWVGITGLLTALGLSIKPEMAESISALGIAVASFVLFVWNDKK